VNLVGRLSSGMLQTESYMRAVLSVEPYAAERPGIALRVIPEGTNMGRVPYRGTGQYGHGALQRAGRHDSGV
jgi:hypothetical protein